MMIGAIVGVGVFGLPYVFAQAGFAVALLELLAIAILLTILQLMQAEVAIQTPGKERLAGFVRHYMGKQWSWLAVAALSASIWGAMLAYMIVGGNFLFLLLSPLFGGTETIYSLIIALFASLLIYRGLQFASRIEVTIVGALLLLFLFIILVSLPHIQFSSYHSTASPNFFLPYGIILFSLAGVGIVPEMREVLGKRLKSRLGHAVMIGMAIIVLLYILFSATVIGVTGANTTPVAFDGLVPVLGNTFRVVSTILGTLTILSIYFVLGIELLNTFRVDFRLPHKLSWFLVTSVPVILFLAGAREFIQVIGFVGSVFGGALGILVVLTYLKMKKSPLCRERTCLNFPNVLAWGIILVFFLGIIFEFFS